MCMFLAALFSVVVFVGVYHVSAYLFTFILLNETTIFAACSLTAFLAGLGVAFTCFHKLVYMFHKLVYMFHSAAVISLQI